jgi:hypothetical protein
MPSAPFDTDLVIARITAQVTELKQVRGAAEYAAIKDMTGFAPPEGFVLLAREQGSPQPGNTRQAAQAFFGVVLAVRNYRQQRGKPAVDDLRPLVGKVRDALIGWIPSNAQGAQLKGGRGCQWLRGDVLDYTSGTLLWREIYQTQHFIGSTAQ